jgi:CheY-like chemotaxis protein
MKKILIVDDEPDVRALLKTRLTANGFEVFEASDGASGVTLALEKHPDLILLDIMMPGQDGVETYHKMKSDPGTQGIPVIFLTALADRISLTKKGLELEESYAILGKPYRADELVQEIRRALGFPILEEQRGEERNQKA